MDIVSHEGWPKRSHLIENTSHGPNIALAIVGQISPDFRTGIVGGPSLGAGKSALADLADVQVSQLDLFVILAKEEVSTLNISMEYVHSMECLQAVEHLNSHSPDFVFWKVFLASLVALDEAGEISP